MKTIAIDHAFQQLIKTAFLLVAGLIFAGNLQAARLLIGTATADITPSLPVAIDGQFYMRIAKAVETPLSVNVVALEAKDGDRSLDMAVMVSCDIVTIPASVIEDVRAGVHAKISGLDPEKIFLNAIHTHTAPVLHNDMAYPIPEKGVLQVEEYRDFFIRQVVSAVIDAWKSRRPGTVSWGLGHAAVANNRRVVYSKKVEVPGVFSDGKAKMYGKTDVPEFMNIEGMADDGVNVLFFWDQDRQLEAACIEVACPAQEMEGGVAVNADYWYPVREKLKQRFGPDLVVLAWIGAAGDQSPHLLYNKAAEERMIKLRNLSRLEEIGRRISLAVEETYETVKNNRYEDVEFVHKVEIVNLPLQKITEEEYAFARKMADDYKAQMAADPASAEKLMGRYTWNEDAVRRYESQKKGGNTEHATEIHILRIGDIAISTNPFELFTDYGIQIQARSKALQTFIIQLTGPGSYLPTEKAMEGGGYSAIVQSVLVGPEGGHILVNRTVDEINKLWKETGN